ncbi:MAG: 2-C-methyl-D-erythritol 2,4-cyclodiphosphate synthase [Mariprofundaceae bacterium]
MNVRIGQGFDVHAFAGNRRLILGGANIPFHLGLAGHSDADVLTHAVMDALLGAAGLGDIGQHFPDNDLAYKDADSLILLSQVMRHLEAEGWQVGNIDATIIAQEPKLAPFIQTMRENLARVLGVDSRSVNIKATTTELLGFIGRKEGVAVMAVALIHPFS